MARMECVDNMRASKIDDCHVKVLAAEDGHPVLHADGMPRGIWLSQSFARVLADALKVRAEASARQMIKGFSAEVAVTGYVPLALNTDSMELTLFVRDVEHFGEIVRLVLVLDSVDRSRLSGTLRSILDRGCAEEDGAAVLKAVSIEDDKDAESEDKDEDADEEDE